MPLEPALLVVEHADLALRLPHVLLRQEFLYINLLHEYRPTLAFRAAATVVLLFFIIVVFLFRDHRGAFVRVLLLVLLESELQEQVPRLLRALEVKVPKG
jgi:hypothetical protein